MSGPTRRSRPAVFGRLPEVALTGGQQAILLLVVIATLSSTAGAVTKIDVLENLDYMADGAIVAAAAVHLVRRRKQPLYPPGFVWLVAFLIIGVLSALLVDVEAALLVQALIILVRLPLVAWAVAQFDWQPGNVPAIARRAVLFGAFICVGAVLNFVIGTDWAAVFTQSPAYIDYRYGLLSVQGWFSHPLIEGNIGAVLVAFVVAATPLLTGRYRLVGIVSTALATLMTYRRTAMVGAIVGAVVALPRRSRTSAAVVGLVTVPLVVVAVWNEIVSTVADSVQTYVVDAGTQARTILLSGAVSTADDHFPFGAGFTRFASPIAGSHYSPEYVSRGYQYIWGLQDKPGIEGAFLNDTQWPAILGEGGWIGLAFFVLFLFAVIRMFHRLSREPRMELQAFGRGGLGVTTAVLIASIGIPVLIGTPVGQLFYALIGIGTALSVRPKPRVESLAAPVPALTARRAVRR